MLIGKAIEKLEDHISIPEHIIDLDFEDAVKLGIAALEEVRRLRTYKGTQVYKLLPGEAEE